MLEPLCTLVLALCFTLEAWRVRRLSARAIKSDTLYLMQQFGAYHSDAERVAHRHNQDRLAFWYAMALFEWAAFAGSLYYA